MTHEKDKKRKDALKKKGGEIEALALFKQGGEGETLRHTVLTIFVLLSEAEWDVSLA